MAFEAGEKAVIYDKLKELADKRKEKQPFRRDLNNVNIPTTQDIDNMFSNDGVINAIVKLNDPSIKSIVDTFTNPQMIKMINSVSRMQSYMKKISDKEKNNDD